MLASYLHNFIFIKTQKTGSTTIETVLADACGPKDVITPLGHRDELKRSNGKLVCRNFFLDPEQERIWTDAVLSRDKQTRRKMRKMLDFWAHMSASEIRERVEPEFWSSAYKFTIERHPYEKAYSRAAYDYTNRGRLTFEEFLDRAIRNGNYSTNRYYMIDGKVAVDEILRLETIEDDLRRVGKKLGLSLPDELPRTKSHDRSERRPARQLLTDRQKDIVYEFCKVEFDLLGYER